MNVNQTEPYMHPTFITLDASSFPHEGPWRVIIHSLVPLALFAIMLNLGVLGACVMRRFDKPMVFYIALCVIADTLWVCVITATFVRGLLGVKRHVYFTECLLHVCSINCVGHSQLLIQWMMDVDRYWAIFWPYSYARFMAKKRGMFFLAFCIISLGIITKLFDGIFASLLYFCKHELIISEGFCMVGFLLNISCGGKTSSNLTCSYCDIFFVHIVNHHHHFYLLEDHPHFSSTFSNKALHTCCTQIMVFVLKVGSRMAFVISVRLGDHSVSFRLILYILCIFTSPIADPLIYGLRTKEIREPLTRLYQRASKNYL
uniref:G-protein coupled receptors family 1 profile domain-containing protein n=1 Tax=Eptatretus burgeri TaxID=7764 RepID=A0A8C4QSZ3_EPTBU